MSLDRLEKAEKKTVGSKQTIKAVQKGEAKVVYLALDVEERIKQPLLQLCREKNVEVITVDTMLELGRACGIKVGSAAVAIIVDSFEDKQIGEEVDNNANH